MRRSPHTQRRRTGTRNPTGCGGPGGRFGVAPRASAGVRGAVSVVRGGNLPAAVQSIAPRGWWSWFATSRSYRIEAGAERAAWHIPRHSWRFLRTLEACGPVLLG